LELNESIDLGDAHEQYQHEDPWQPKIARWLDDPTNSNRGFTVEDVLNHAIKRDDDKQTKGDEMRVGGILTAIGYSRKRAQVNGARAYRWYVNEG
jgi:hypothetical protein